MSSLTYSELKNFYINSENEFSKRFASENCLMKSVIETIATSPNDNGWPLAMLTALQPSFANALRYWSAQGYKEIRYAQESESVVVGSPAYHMEANFSLLPLWNAQATHVSKDPNWFSRLQCGTFELRSFMGCCAPGYTFAYASSPVATLKFSSLKTARLVGALSAENLEGEVLLPKGAVFRVTSMDRATKTIYLTESSCPESVFCRA